jgi:hypothetical protein
VFKKSTGPLTIASKFVLCAVANYYIYLKKVVVCSIYCNFCSINLLLLWSSLFSYLCMAYTCYEAKGFFPTFGRSKFWYTCTSKVNAPSPRFKGSDQRKIRRVGKLASVRRWFRTVAIDVCLLFNLTIVLSSTNFRFLFVKPK